MDDHEASLSARSLTRAQRQRANEWTAVYFAIAMLGFVTIFTISHWVSFLLKKYPLLPTSRLVKSILHTTRYVSFHRDFIFT